MSEAIKVSTAFQTDHIINTFIHEHSENIKKETRNAELFMH